VIVILTFSEEDQNKPYKCSSVEEWVNPLLVTVCVCAFGSREGGRELNNWSLIF
jgi:hypothetical protein